EKAQPVGTPIAGPTVDRCIRPEIDIPEAGVAPIAMGPWSQDQTLWPTPGALQTSIVAGSGQRIRVPPRRHVHALRAAVGRVRTFGPNAKLLPERPVGAMRPLVKQVRLIIRMVAQRR